jgi:hypothetical protein
MVGSTRRLPKGQKIVIIKPDEHKKEKQRKSAVGVVVPISEAIQKRSWKQP